MRLIILGAGGHGKVVEDLALQSSQYDSVYFLDDHSTDENVLGKCNEYEKYNDGHTEMYPAFGNNELRLEWEHKLEEAHIPLALIIHPTAYISPKAHISRGCVIMPYAIVNTNTTIYKACIINCGAIVDHDCIVNEGCHIGPGGIVKAINKLPECTKVDSGEVVILKQYQ